jgi:hypothetical protein
MRKIHLMTLAAVLATGAAVPAFADRAVSTPAVHAPSGIVQIQYRDGYRDNDYRDRYRGYDNDRDRYRRSQNERGWVRLGMESFEGRYDRESDFAGFRGRDIDSIGLRPVNGDARCSRITATFRNGRTRDLYTANFLPENRITRIDLPGNDRNLMRVNLACRAVGARQVTIEILGAG